MITTEHTIWCSRCVHWEQEAEPRKTRFKGLKRQQGWRLIKKEWVCPACVAAKVPKSKEVAHD